MSSEITKRTSRAKYSRNGCLPCSRSKVKCDEDHPRCQRCTRLVKECVWREPQIPLRQRRRGLGPLKERTSYTPRQLQPAADPQLSVTMSPASTHSLDSVTTEDFSSVIIVSPIPASLNLSQIPSSSSVILGKLEKDGLYYYENVLSIGVQKSFGWSVFAIMLSAARGRGDIMHLVLAWSLFDMAESCDKKDVLQAAKTHFQKGTEMFVMNLHTEQVDHCASAIGFWLLQLVYRTVWDSKASTSMKKLSASIFDYLKTHQLLERLTNDEDHSWPHVEKSMFSLFLLFTVYEEVAPEFGIAGGELSDFILSDENLSMTIFSLSRSCFEHHFGDQYPSEELLDDMQRSKPLELNLQANIILQQMNKFRKQGGPTIEELMQFLNSVKETKYKYSSLFKLVKAPCISNTKFMITTLRATAILNAVVISVLGDLVALVNDEGIIQQFQEANDELRHCVYNALKLSPCKLPWRSHWPVYVAAAWAEDDIHADWFLHKLGNSRYSTVLKGKS